MSHESIHEHLLISARKWARTAVDAYLEEPIDQDFAVHHMAVAVEHASKAYLASIAPVLLASEKQPSVDDLLVLSGNEDKTVSYVVRQSLGCSWGGVRGVGLFRTGCGRSRSR